MKKNFLILLLNAAMVCHAQEPVIEKYNWLETPPKYSLTEKEKANDEIILLESSILDFQYDENGDLTEYIIYHKVTGVNTDNGIEMNNKIYLNLNETSNVLVQKARVINPDGTVITLKDEDIKEAVDEENNQKYKYFALEGLQKGSDIEYFYILKMNPVYTGAIMTLQSDVPERNVEFKIITPSNLLFSTKSLNGCPEMIADTSSEGFNILRLNIDTIAAAKKEEFAVYEPNLMQVIYKLNSNLTTSKNGIVNYKTVAQTIYDMIYTSRTEAETKEVNKFIKKLSISSADNLKDKIRNIEQQLKSRIAVVKENSANELSDINFIITHNVASEDGIVKLYAAIFDALGINHELVLTTDRSKKKFDKDFEAYTFLTDYLIYFPELDQYLAPSEIFYRSEYIPFDFTNNYGLFIRQVKVGDFKTGVGEVRFIPALDYKKNTDNILANVSFETDLQHPTISYQNSFTGLYAQYFQPFYSVINDDQKKELNENIMKNFLGDVEVGDINVENAGSENFGIKPFIVNTKFDGEQFVSKAGDNYLFKIGDLLGPQAELYQEDARKFEVENDFNRIYNREINFNIPQGYEVKNLDALKINKFFIDPETGERTLSFNSDYTIEGNTVHVIIAEYYANIMYPLAMYENFREVVNAAADFNKVVMIFEKK